jgi:hypothetical protein
LVDYVISEEDLNDAEVFGLLPDSPICQKARSRPLSEAIAEHNAGVIKELERLENYMVDHCVDTSAVSYHKAIILIRDGVK